MANVWMRAGHDKSLKKRIAGLLCTSGGLSLLLVVLLVSPSLVCAQTAPVQIYFENFENRPNPTTTPQAITAYTGAAAALNETYNATASSYWNNGSFCNGEVVSNASASNFAGCSATGAVGGLAYFMGIYHGLSSAAANNESVLAAYTAVTNNASGSNVEFITNNLITIPGIGQHFITFGVDTIQTSCPGDPNGAGGTYSGTSPAQYNFFLVNAGGATTQLNGGGAVNACNGGTIFQPGGPGGGIWRAKSIVANTPIAVTAGSSYRLRMDNTTTSATGNDGAVDNFVLLDVTPSVSKSFSPTTVAAGGTVTLTFTVTNTTDLLAKPGWSFTDNLPAGMTLASTAVGGTCRNSAGTAGTTATLTGAVGATSIGIAGNLPAVVSCTVMVSVQVGSTVTSPTLQNCGSNFASSILVIPPASGTCAVLNVTRPVNLTKVWKNAVTGDTVSLTITGANVSSNVSGTSTAPSTTTPDVEQALLGSSVTVAEAFTSGSAGGYVTTLDCQKVSNGATVTVSQSGLSGAFTMPVDSGVNCIFTNQKVATLTLRKQWSGAVVGDDATVTVSRGATVLDTLVSDAGSANELDTDLTPVTVNAGDVLTLAEVLAVANTGLYNSAIACIGTSGLSGATLTVGNTDSAIVCTYTNARQQADLSITKSNGGTQVVSGTTTTYTIVARNGGPNAANNAVVKDVPGAGLSGCVATCTSTAGGAVCPATPADVFAAGGTAIPVFPANSSVTFTVACAVL